MNNLRFFINTGTDDEECIFSKEYEQNEFMPIPRVSEHVWIEDQRFVVLDVDYNMDATWNITDITVESEDIEDCDCCDYDCENCLECEDNEPHPYDVWINELTSTSSHLIDLLREV